MGVGGYLILGPFSRDYGTCQPIITNCVVALQLVAWALLGNHSSTITIQCVYSTYYGCNGCNQYSCLWNKHTMFYNCTTITITLLVRENCAV